MLLPPLLLVCARAGRLHPASPLTPCFCLPLLECL